jgi:pyruvate dehydrogenase kinase 2/3/4
MEAQHYAHSAIDSNLVMQFLRDRLGIQLLCDHYVALNKGKPGGGISVSSDFTDVLTDAVLESKHVCDANLGTAPDVHVLDSDLSPDQMHLTFVKPWVHHALVELLKNGMASSVQKAIDTDLQIPVPELYIKVTSHGESGDSLVCHVFDQGVGLEKESPRKAFEFAKSSSLKRWDRIDEQQSYAMVRAPLGSLGVGLPMSQIMMQSFGGDIHLQNRECGYMHKEIGTPLGSGCTSSLILPRDDAIIGI